MKKKLLTFILTLALWLVFAGRINFPVFLLGTLVTIICSIISRMFAAEVFKLLLMNYEVKVSFVKIYYIFLVVGAFIYDAFLSAIRVSRHVFEIKPSFSPRTVQIKTSLQNLPSIMILSNLIALTPGTLIMDFNILNRNYFIHWIDIRSEDEAALKKALIGKHEKWIAKIFE